MNDNKLSVEQIITLSESLKTSPEISYQNIGVNMGNGIVEIFKPENYEKLFQYLLSCPELNVQTEESNKVKKAIIDNFTKINNSNSSPELKIGKLCSAYFLVNRKNLAHNWSFYYVPEEYRIPGLLRYQLITPQQSPVAKGELSPPVFMERQSYSQSHQKDTAGRGSRGGRGNRGGRGGSDQKREVTPNERSDTRAITQQKTVNSNIPIKPLFSGFSSRINTFEAPHVSQIPLPVVRQSMIPSILEEKNKIIKLIKSSIEEVPHTKILCNINTGVCSFHRIDEDEHFETSGFEYCPFHSGRNLDSFGIISESLRKKITGPFGYFTKSSECYDSCHKAISSSLSSEETNEIKAKRKGINDILLTIEKSINEFNTLVDSRDDLIREEFSAKQLLQVASAEFETDLGDNADRNVQFLQTIISNPLIEKQKRVSKQGRSQSIEYVFPDLPIMNYTAMSSFFGNLNNIINELDNVGIEMVIYDVNVTLPQSAVSQILKSISEIRSNIVTTTAEVFSVGNNLYVKINNTPISFQLSSMVSTNIAMRVINSQVISNFDRDFTEIKLIPVYEVGSYRAAIFKLGKSFCQDIGIYEYVKNKYDIILYIGMCYLSENAALLSLLTDYHEDLARKHLLIKSNANKCEINIDQIHDTLTSLNDGIDGSIKKDFIRFEIGEGLSLEVQYEEAKNVLKQLSSLPSIVDDEVILSDDSHEYKIPVSEFNLFFKTLQSKLDELSNKAKKEDHKKEKENVVSTENLTSTNTGVWQSVNSLLDKHNGSTVEDTLTIKQDKKKSSKQSKKKSAKKDIDDNDTKSETHTVHSKSTAFSRGDYNNSISSFNSRYFDEEFEIFGYTMNGFDAQNLLFNYFNAKSVNLEDRVVTITIDNIPLVDFNMPYIFSKLFAEDETLIESMFPDGVLVDRKYALATILFGSSAKYFNIPINGVNQNLKLKSELELLNPYKARRELDFAIPASEARKSKLLSRYMEYMGRIDKIAILARRETIEKFGNDVFKTIFTGYHTRINDVLTPVSFSNRQGVVRAAGIILNKRSHLRRFYNDIIKPFLDKVHSQDSISNELPTYYGSVGDYIVFSRANDHKIETQLVIPSNPLYTTVSLNEEFTELTFPNELLEYVDVQYQLTPIDTQNASNDLDILMRLMFPGNDNIVLQMINPRYTDCLINTKSATELSKMGLILKFRDLLDIIGNKLNPVNLNSLNNSFNWISKVYEAIIDGSISKNKMVDDLPSLRDIPIELERVIKRIREALLCDLPVNHEESIVSTDENDEIEVIKRPISFFPLDLFDCFLNSFQGVVSVFNHRRKTMREYVKRLVSNFYDVKATQSTTSEQTLEREFRFSSFEDIDRNVDSNNRVINIDHDKIDVIEMGISKCLLMIESFSRGRVDPHLRVSESVPILDLDVRLKIYNKFANIIMNTSNESEYNTIVKAVAYHLISTLDKKLYDIYLVANYTVVMQSVDTNAINIFKQDQERLYSDLELMAISRDKKQSALGKVGIIGSNIAALNANIKSKESILTVNFVEYVALVDIILKSYENRKKSYGSDDSDFNELIENMKLRLESIKNSYEKVNVPEIKIILSFFNDNFEIYKIRKSIFSDFKFTAERIGEFNSLVSSAVEYIKIYGKLPRSKQIESLNNKIASFGISVKTTLSELENAVRSQLPSQQEEIKKQFIKCLFANKMLNMMENEIQNTKVRLLNKKVEPLIVPKRDEQPKIEGYGQQLNDSLTNLMVDHFTYQSLQILSKNITQFLEMYQSGLKVVDSGPGLHLLSDAIENFISFIVPSDHSSSPELFKRFVSSFKKFEKFNSSCGKTTNDIIQSSDFKLFVSIINGKLNEFSSVTSSINFFDKVKNPQVEYEGLTTKFVRGLLLTFSEIANEGVFIEVDTILDKFSNHCETKYDYNNLSILINTIADFNVAIIQFIDEYVDEEGMILNDIQVIEYRNTHNLKTRGDFMINMFKKLNYCVKKFIKKQNEELEINIVDKFIVYSELFSKKFESLSSLEKYMIKR